MEVSYEERMVNQIFSVQYKFDNILGEMIANIFNLYDVDGDGNLDYDDYISFISDLMYISILMKRMKNTQYNIDNVLKIVKWTASNIARNLFDGMAQFLPFEVFSKKIMYALTEYNSSPISSSDMHFSSLLPEFMNFFNYYIQLAQRRGWPSILHIGQSQHQPAPVQPPQPQIPQEQPETQPIQEMAPPPEIAQAVIQEPTIPQITAVQQPSDFSGINQFDMPDEVAFPTIVEPPHELEVKEGIVIKASEMGYDMIEGDLNINNYIYSNMGENIAFKVGENYFLTNKTIIRTMVNMGEKDNAIFFGCTCEIKDDWTRPETWAMLQHVVVNDPAYFNIQHIGLPIRYVLLKDIMAVLESDMSFFYIERPENAQYIPSFASDNILNHGIGSMSGVHCQDGQRDIIYRIKKFKPRFAMF
uniref:EF-hand domain-containing protein n=1 Tax=viral metagenome TaxID=1070528 RepID=A0A6C0KJE5_9ZZZZ